MNPLKIVTAVMLISLMLEMGLICDRDHLIAALKNYQIIARALLANFILVPIFGVLAVRLFQLNDYVATGLLLMAIAPGVPFIGLAGGRSKGGSLGLALALAFLMPVISVITIPLTAPLVIPAGEVGRVSANHLLVPLVLCQLVPLLIGMGIVDRAPALAARLTRPVRLIFVASLLVVLALLFPAIVKAIGSVYGSRGMLATLFVVILSLAAGWIVSTPDPKYKRTLAIGTALRNIGLCAFIATTDFPDTLVAPTVLTYLIVQVLVCAIAGVYFRRTMSPIAPAAA